MRADDGLHSNLSASELNRSADDRSTLFATPVQDSRRGTVWRWQMYGRDSAEELATLFLPESYLPRALLDEQFLWHRERSLERVQGRTKELPAQLIALDSHTGVEQWSLAVRSTIYTGPAIP